MLKPKGKASSPERLALDSLWKGLKHKNYILENKCKSIEPVNYPELHEKACRLKIAIYSTNWLPSWWQCVLAFSKTSKTFNMSCRHGTCDSCSGSADWVGSSSFVEHLCRVRQAKGNTRSEARCDTLKPLDMRNPVWSHEKINANWVVLEGSEGWPCNRFPVKFCPYNFGTIQSQPTQATHGNFMQLPLLQTVFTITKWWRLFGQCFLHWLGLCQALLGMLHHHRYWGTIKCQGWLSSATYNILHLLEGKPNHFDHPSHFTSLSTVNICQIWQLSLESWFIDSLWNTRLECNEHFGCKTWFEIHSIRPVATFCKTFVASDNFATWNSTTIHKLAAGKQMTMPSAKMNWWEVKCEHRFHLVQRIWFCQRCVLLKRVSKGHVPSPTISRLNKTQIAHTARQINIISTSTAATWIQSWSIIASNLSFALAYCAVHDLSHAPIGIQKIYMNRYQS